MRILVCGGRDFGFDLDECQFIYKVLDKVDEEFNGLITIISGEAKGVDRIAKYWALYPDKQLGYCSHPYKGFKADWEKYGKKAGYIRNKQMLDEGRPDLVIAFPGGKGTAMMVDLAKKAGVEVREIKYEK